MAPETIETRLLINGKLVEASDRGTFPLYNPANREKIVDVPEASEEDTNAAVAAAKAAFPAWSALSPMHRAQCFKRLAGLMRQSSDEFAYLDAVSMGRPTGRYIDALACAAEFDYYAEAWTTALGTSSLNTPGFVNMTVRQPYGVAAAIIPWNFPLISFGKKVAPALMAGNTVVLKSSEKAPLTSAKVAALVEQAGFPPGVLNILSGHGPLAGGILSSHMDVRVLSFTGSGRTGRLIQIAAAKSNMKNLILELGGKTPAVVFEDADLAKAVAETQNSIQWNCGQTCMANSRIYVQESISQQFLELFKEKFATIKAGDPTSKDVTYGPQAGEIQYNTILGYIEEGKKTSTLALGGKSIQELQGYYIEPTIFINVSENAKIMKEEIFGPVVIINTFRNEGEVVQKANDSEYGLYASVYTKNIDRAMRVAKAFEAGTVAVNCTSPSGAFDMPSGGFKGSGVGREGRCCGLDSFLETKTVIIKVDDA
ncbi:aldehyde dehydrogenase [Xylogone sp. PMI_703]|nr:aldehyde dehydrogenase [Xylogone sp. PMI_703]